MTVVHRQLPPAAPSSPTPWRRRWSLPAGRVRVAGAGRRSAQHHHPRHRRDHRRDGRDLDRRQYKPSKVPIEDLLNAVPDIHKIANVKGEQVVQIASQAMTPELWQRLANRANELLAGDVDGIVVTHGTDTMEETAYFLDLVVHSDKPVVLVGSMRPATAISADGPRNLYNAVTLASSPEARAKGVLITLNDTILPARGTTKRNTTNVATFTAPDSGPMGTVGDGKVTFYDQPLRKHTAQSELKEGTERCRRSPSSTATPATAARRSRRRSMPAPRASSSPASATATSTPTSRRRWPSAPEGRGGGAQLARRQRCGDPRRRGRRPGSWGSSSPTTWTRSRPASC